MTVCVYNLGGTTAKCRFNAMLLLGHVHMKTLLGQGTYLTQIWLISRMQIINTCVIHFYQAYQVKMNILKWLYSCVCSDWLSIMYTCIIQNDTLLLFLKKGMHTVQVLDGTWNIHHCQFGDLLLIPTPMGPLHIEVNLYEC